MKERFSFARVFEVAGQHGTFIGCAIMFDKKTRLSILTTMAIVSLVAVGCGKGDMPATPNGGTDSSLTAEDVVAAFREAGFTSREVEPVEVVREMEIRYGAESSHLILVNGEEIGLLVYDLSGKNAQDNIDRAVSEEQRTTQSHNLLIINHAEHPQIDSIYKVINTLIPDSL